MSELLLGCGSSRVKQIGVNGRTGWHDLVTLDINPDHEPDVVWDLDETPWPFDDEAFDEVHAYEVFEHLGRQGDAVSFFACFYECWRILRDGGWLIGTVPDWQSVWAWGDPGHRRVITPETFVFLDREEYECQVGVTNMTDYRDIWHGDFVRKWIEVADAKTQFVLRARK